MPHAITVRKLPDPPGETCPRYWFGGDVFLTHFFNAISSTFPDGERFFIRAVRHYQHQVSDPALLEAIRCFVGQEGQHSREHDAHVALLKAQGYGILERLNRNQRAVMTFFNERTPRYALALTAGVEHITAALARSVMTHPETWIAPMHPTMQPLWRWHAVEEAEHKSVAFDVYRTTGGPRWLRRLAMLHATFAFHVEVFFRHLLLLHRDRALSLLILRQGWHKLWGRDGFLRALRGELGVYYRADFHPDQHDDQPLLSRRRLEWLLG
ncbi:MAG: metal-dependent hydrolase [Pseudomonadales bacterium]|nr:metal-dependent hydrolase [Pseudomonadales bacterium]MCP5184795.1 metal-dependent hydrolase [Pseudomonadales bacterium]